MIRFQYRYYNLDDRAVTAMLKSLVDWLNEYVGAELDLNIKSIDNGSDSEDLKLFLNEHNFVAFHPSYKPQYLQYFAGERVHIWHVATSTTNDYWADQVHIDFKEEGMAILYKIEYPKEYLFDCAEIEEAIL